MDSPKKMREDIVHFDKKDELEGQSSFTLDIKPVTNAHEDSSAKKKSQPTPNQKYVHPGRNKSLKKINSHKEIKSEKKLPAAKSKVKLDPLEDKKAIIESSGNPYVNEKTNRLLTLTKLTQPLKLQ